LLTLFRTVALSKMMNDEGLVVGIEHIPQLANLATENIKKNHKNLLDEEKIVILASDGRIGCEKYAPYDVIHVGAGKIIIIQPLLKSQRSLLTN
jgi:protein-L-isoaspartate(D-aspartate) O-methyltransferase